MMPKTIAMNEREAHLPGTAVIKTIILTGSLSDKELKAAAKILSVNSDSNYVPLREKKLANPVFKSRVLHLINAPELVIVSAANTLKSEFLDDLISRPDTVLFYVTPDNRDYKLAAAQTFIHKFQKSERYAGDPLKFIQQHDHIDFHSTHGARVLQNNPAGWSCSCDYYQEANICSHLLAYFKTQGDIGFSAHHLFDKPLWTRLRIL